MLEVEVVAEPATLADEPRVVLPVAPATPLLLVALLLGVLFGTVPVVFIVVIWTVGARVSIVEVCAKDADAIPGPVPVRATGVVFVVFKREAEELSA